VGSDGNGLHSARKNFQRATDHPKVVEDYLHLKLSSGRISCRYSPSMCPDVLINRFGIIPKKHQQDTWRLITDLSHPSGSSVNDAIPSNLRSLNFLIIDDVILNILQYGRNTMLAKMDVQSAFRLLPVHPADRHLLGIKWRDQTYIDHCIPFGLHLAPKLFSILADLLAWITQNAGVSYLIHYLDNYSTIHYNMSAQRRHIYVLVC